MTDMRTIFDWSTNCYYFLLKKCLPFSIITVLKNILLTNLQMNITQRTLYLYLFCEIKHKKVLQLVTWKIKHILI